jgi:hypothetical protein
MLPDGGIDYDGPRWAEGHGRVERMARKPRYDWVAETDFAHKGEFARAACTPPRRDVNGWDWYVELPVDGYDGPG